MSRLVRAIVKALLVAAAFVCLSELLGLRMLQEAGGVTTLQARHAAPDESAVRAAVSRFHAAIAGGDAAGAMAVVAPDAIFLEAGGVETRAQYEKDHLPGDIGFEKTVTVTRSPLRVIVSGDAAWTTCTSEFKGTYNGKPVDSIGTELMVLSRTAAGWQIRAVHWSSRARPVKK